MGHEEGYSGQEMANNKGYDLGLSGTAPMPASVSKCPRPPRVSAEMGIASRGGLNRFGGIIAKAMERRYEKSCCDSVERSQSRPVAVWGFSEALGQNQ